MQIPYARPALSEDDIQAAVQILRGPHIGLGPITAQVEQAFSESQKVRCTVAVQSGTAALQLAYRVLFQNRRNRDRAPRVFIPGIEFVAAASMAVEEGALLFLGEVDVLSGNLDLMQLESRLKNGLEIDVVCAVSYAGFPFDFPKLAQLSAEFGFQILADQCHTAGIPLPGAEHHPDLLQVFSFQSLKHLTSGEGGTISTNSEEIAAKLRVLRNHGTSRNLQQPSAKYRAEDFYAHEVGFNTRLTDFQSALLLSQLQRLPEQLSRRKSACVYYKEAFSGINDLAIDPHILHENHGRHLFTVRSHERDRLFEYLRSFGIGVQVHYVPLHRHPALQPHFHPEFSRSASAEKFFRSILSIPLFDGISTAEQDFVIEKVRRFYATGCC